MKNRYRLILLVTLMLAGNMVRAQHASGSISGIIKDTSGNPIPAATIYLLKAQNSALVRTGVADSGRFRFQHLDEGTYKLVVTCIGFTKYEGSPLVVHADSIVTAPLVITLMPTSNRSLKEVTVFGKKPFLELKIDRTVVNVGQMITAGGSNMLDLLNELPGVRVDYDGGISLKGRDGTLILVDGKQTYLTGGDMAAYLRTLNAATIEKVEIIPVPPAKYDAAGSGGIINIITRKNMNGGFNGGATVSNGQGVYQKINAAVNLNYRVKKLNFFGNLSYSNPPDFEKSAKSRIYLDSTGAISSRFQQTGYTKFERQSYTFKLGMDYFQSKNTTMGFVLNGLLRPSRDLGGNTTYLQDAQGNTDSSATFTNNSINRFWNGNLNLNMVHKFNQPGSELDIDLDYVYYTSSSNETFNYSYFDKEGLYEYQNALLGNLPRTIYVYAGKADYSFTIGKQWKMESGWKSSLVKTDNQATYTDVNGNVETPDYGKSNTFKYNENINAVYLSADRAFKKLELKGGLRVEQTVAQGDQLGNFVVPDSSFSFNYINIFPTFFLAYKFDSVNRNMITISYGKRINRPNYQLLNPFLGFVDRYYEETGNPFLKPQIIHTAEVNYIYKRILTTTAFMDYNINNFSREINLRDSNIFVNTPANIGKTIHYGLSLELDMDLTKWWYIDAYAEAGAKQVKSMVNLTQVDTSVKFYTIQMRNEFKLNKGWSMELFGFYSSRDFTGQFAVKPQGEVNAGISKRFNNGSLSANIRDMFYTRISRGEILYIPSTLAFFDNRRDTRVFTVSYTRQFGRANNQNRRRRSGSVETEQSRISSDNK